MKFIYSILILVALAFNLMAQPVAVRATNGVSYFQTLYNGTNYGSSAKTNWTWMDAFGWHNTNSGTALRGTDISNGNLSAGGYGGGAGAARDFTVDADNKMVFVGRLSTTSSDNSTFVVRNRLNAAIIYASTGGSGLVGFGLTNPATTVHIVSQSAFSQLRIGNTNSGVFSGVSLVGDPTTFNWLMAEQNNIAGLEFTPSTAVGGLTFSAPLLSLFPTYTVAVSGTLNVATNLNVTNIFTLGSNFVQSAGASIKLTSGTNQRAGNATLVGGTVTVNNTTVTANTLVFLTRKTSGGTIGTAITYTLSAGASFTINSDSVIDTSTFSYLLIENP